MSSTAKKYDFGSLFKEAGASTDKLHVVRRDNIWHLIREDRDRSVFKSFRMSSIMRKAYEIIRLNSVIETLVIHNFDGSVDQIIPASYIKKTFAKQYGKRPRNSRLKKI